MRWYARRAVDDSTLHGEEAMLEVLLESRAVRAKRMGGTLTSVLVHGALIAGIVALSVRTKSVEARVPDVVEHPPYYIPVNPDAGVSRSVARPVTERHDTPETVAAILPTIDRIPTEIPQVELTATTITDATEFTRRVGQDPGGAGRHGLGGPIEGVLEERYVDRSPRILGSPIQPDFPASLRERGINGRVSMQFVVDTLGRAEMSGLRVVEATDPLFAQSVRAVLGRYRFSPGEVGGQKVRTLVQLPFDFTLVR
jgi:protein TonB